MKTDIKPLDENVQSEIINSYNTTRSEKHYASKRTTKKDAVKALAGEYGVSQRKIEDILNGAKEDGRHVYSRNDFYGSFKNEGMAEFIHGEVSGKDLSVAQVAKGLGVSERFAGKVLENYLSDRKESNILSMPAWRFRARTMAVAAGSGVAGDGQRFPNALNSAGEGSPGSAEPGFVYSDGDVFNMGYNPGFARQQLKGKEKEITSKEALENALATASYNYFQNQIAEIDKGFAGGDKRTTIPGAISALQALFGGIPHNDRMNGIRGELEDKIKHYESLKPAESQAEREAREMAEAMADSKPRGDDAGHGEPPLVSLGMGRVNETEEGPDAMHWRHLEIIQKAKYESPEAKAEALEHMLGVIEKDNMGGRLNDVGNAVYSEAELTEQEAEYDVATRTYGDEKFDSQGKPLIELPDVPEAPKGPGFKERVRTATRKLRETGEHAAIATKAWYNRNVNSILGYSVLGAVGAVAIGTVAVLALSSRMKRVEEVPEVAKAMADIKYNERIEKTQAEQQTTIVQYGKDISELMGRTDEQGRKVETLDTKVDEGFKKTNESLKSTNDAVKGTNDNILALGKALKTYADDNNAAHTAINKTLAEQGKKPVPVPQVPVIPVEEGPKLADLRTEYNAVAAEIGKGAGSIEAEVYQDMIDAAQTDAMKKRWLMTAIEYLNKSKEEAKKNKAIAQEFKKQ